VSDHSQISHAREREIIVRLFLGMIREVYSHRFKGQTGIHVGAQMEAIFITMAVMVGQFEHCEMSAFKIAQYLAMPRRTVTRKLAWLVEQRQIIKTGHTYRLNPDRFPNSPAEAKFIRTLKSLIQKAAHELRS